MLSSFTYIIFDASEYIQFATRICMQEQTEAFPISLIQI